MNQYLAVESKSKDARLNHKESQRSKIRMKSFIWRLESCVATVRLWAVRLYRTSDWCLNSHLDMCQNYGSTCTLSGLIKPHTSELCEGKVEIYWKDPTCWNFDPAAASVLIFPPSCDWRLDKSFCSADPSCPSHLTAFSLLRCEHDIFNYIRGGLKTQTKILSLG